MVISNIEEKVKVTSPLDLLKVKNNSWVEIKGKEEFKIKSDNLKSPKTLYIEGNYVCRNTYNTFLVSMTPIHIEKFLKGTGGAVPYLSILKLKGGLEL
jgi:hypothetical protein